MEKTESQVKSVDYSKIAERYDENRRTLAYPDIALGSLLKQKTQQPFVVLDVGCGTGNYLELQVGYFTDHNVQWFGLEPSLDMLSIARQKVAGGANFVRAFAEAQPFEPDSFNFVTTEFTFHHFSDKQKSLDEMTRILSRGGILRITNILPQKMQNWIYYEYFPGTYEQDLRRFWSLERLKDELENRGLEFSADVRIDKSEWKLSEALAHFRNRDASQLWTISEEEVLEGMALVEDELKQSPERTVIHEIAILACIAMKH